MIDYVQANNHLKAVANQKSQQKRVAPGDSEAIQNDYASTTNYRYESTRCTRYESTRCTRYESTRCTVYFDLTKVYRFVLMEKYPVLSCHKIVYIVLTCLLS